MSYEVEVIESRGRNNLVINIETDDVSIEGLVVEQYYYEDGGEMYGDDLMLLSDGIDIQIDLEENVIREHLGYGEMKVGLPADFIEEIQRKLEANISEWQPHHTTR